MKLEPSKTALLTLDFQKGILGLVSGAEAAIPPAAKAVEFARKKQFQIIHVGLGFAEGHPEIPDHGDSRFARKLPVHSMPRFDILTGITIQFRVHAEPRTRNLELFFSLRASRQL
jgi:nicotinamidase-related amidase